jgi:hypothetical protein
MEDFNNPKFCSVCETKLKRQVIGLNVFYYCQVCGRMSSEACFSGRSDMLQVQEPQSAHKVSSTAGLKLSENAQKATAET